MLMASPMAHRVKCSRHRRLGSIHGSGKCPGERNGNPLQYSCLENSMDRGAWQATVHRVAKELDTTERLTTTIASRHLQSCPNWSGKTVDPALWTMCPPAWGLGLHVLPVNVSILTLNLLQNYSNKNRYFSRENTTVSERCRRASALAYLRSTLQIRRQRALPKPSIRPHYLSA